MNLYKLEFTSIYDSMGVCSAVEGYYYAKDYDTFFNYIWEKLFSTEEPHHKEYADCLWALVKKDIHTDVITHYKWSLVKEDIQTNILTELEIAIVI